MIMMDGGGGGSSSAFDDDSGFNVLPSLGICTVCVRTEYDVRTLISHPCGRSLFVPTFRKCTVACTRTVQVGPLLCYGTCRWLRYLNAQTPCLIH
jgi:hypothetical protein